MALLKKRQVVLFGIESTIGQDPNLTAAANAIKVEDPSWANEETSMIERSVVKNNMSPEQQVYGGGLKTVTFSTEVKGSGTAGTAPEIGPLYRCAGMGETVVGGTSVTYALVSTSREYGTLYYYEDGMLRKLHGCQVDMSLKMEAGGKIMIEWTITGHQMTYGTAQSATATTIVIDANASGVDDTYNGQYIEIISGTGVSATLVAITDYAGATNTVTVASWPNGTPDNTSVYAIHSDPIDVAVVSPTYDSAVPVALKGVPLTIGAYSAAIASLELNLGNEISKPKDIVSPDGFGRLEIIGRDPAGSFDPAVTLRATKDWENEFRTGQQQAIDTGLIGNVGGNIFRLQVPKSYYREIGSGDREGIATYEISYGSTYNSGDDEISLAYT